MTIPKWLKERLGTPKRGRGLKATKCALGCGESILAGFDEDVCAGLALVDPVPLSPLGEALARMDGRRTYRLGRLNEGLALWVRTALNIQNHPASEETIVLGDHRCGGPVFPSVEIKVSPTPAKKSVGCTDPPPF